MNIIRNLIKRSHHRCQSSSLILGIESSCDDTACAIVSGDGRVISESVISQQEEVLRLGGILPIIAEDLHEKNINVVVHNVLKNANVCIDDIDAIAVTTKPGLVKSLLVGMNYAKRLAKKYEKPFIPIHHMKAHALVGRLVNKDLTFPYLTFLISGGHCLLAIVHSISRFVSLGQSLDDAPGEAFDKVARRLKIFNLPEYRSFSGGSAIENAASKGDAFAFTLGIPLLHYADCNFSFAGIKSNVNRIIENEEQKHGLAGDDVLPSINDICASFQYTIAKHLCMRLQRALEFIDSRNILPKENLKLVVAGGVACNSYLLRAFKVVADEYGYSVYVPPRKYCTDNGVMIAWNGIEKYRLNMDVLSPKEIDEVRAESRSPFSEDATKDVSKAGVKCKWIKLHLILHDKESQT